MNGFLLVVAGLFALYVLAVIVLGTLPNHKPPKPPAVPVDTEKIMPRVGTRRWARACYFNNIISLDELCQFYATHPKVDGDSDN
jgi:hypothetical protein